MFPYIEIGSRPIPVYGVAAVIGVVAAIVYLRLIAKRNPSLDADLELSLVYGLIGTFIGAKLLSLITVLPEFIAEFHYLFSTPQQFLQKYLYGGFVFYGGLYGAILAVLIYCRVCRISFSQVVCLLLPVVPLIHGFGRIGCFCMGCCYGVPSEHFGISFHRSEIAPNGVPLVPVQLFEAVLALILFILLVRAAVRKLGGYYSIGLYFTVYGIARFVIEFWRGDEHRGFIGILSTSQAISVLTVAIGITAFVLHKREKRNMGNTAG